MKDDIDLPPTEERFDDLIQSFLIDQTHLHGRFVRLTEVVDTILNRHHYPPRVSHLLGEMLTLASLLSRTLKDEGILTIQVRGDGPVTLMVADVTSEGELRGFADVDKKRIDVLLRKESEHLPLEAIFGKGYLAITLDRGSNKQPYQGIVDLTGDSITEACLNYLQQSEQFTVHMKTAVEKRKIHSKERRWRSAGMLVQRLPEDEHSHQIILPKAEEEQTSQEEPPTEAWNRTCIFVDSLKKKELLDPKLPPRDLLYRLFHQDGVWVYEANPLGVGCRCSRERIHTMLSNMGAEDIQHMIKDGKITVTCQFCNKDEVFDPLELDGKPSA